MLEDALSEVTKVYSLLKLVSQPSWNGGTRLCRGPEDDVNGSGGEGFQAVDVGRRKGREALGNSVMQLPAGKVSGMPQERRSRTCNQCGNTRSGSENDHCAVGSKRELEKEEVRYEVLAGHEESGFSKERHENWCEEVVEDWSGSYESEGSRSWALRPHED